MFKKSIYILLNTLILLFVLDNILFFYHEDNAESKSIVFRHSSNMNYLDKPSKSYIQNSNKTLNKEFNEFRTSPEGFILPAGGVPENESKCSLIFLGGSSTENRWVPEKKRWPTLVGDKLFLKGLKINTKNYGVGGQNLHQASLKYLAYISEEKPDYIFIMHEANDLSKFFKGGYNVREGSLHNSYDVSENRINFKTRLNNVLVNLFPFSYRSYKAIVNENFYQGSERLKSKEYIGLEPIQAAEAFFLRISIIYEIVKANNGKVFLIEYPEIYKNVLFGSNELNKNVKLKLIKELNNNGLSKSEFLDYVLKFRMHLYSKIQESNISLIKFDQDFLEKHFYDAIHFNEEGADYFSSLLATKIFNKVECKN